MNLTNKLFTDAGRPEQGDNRSYFVKALNHILSDGFIQVKISDKGKSWTNKNYLSADGKEKDFNIQIIGYGYKMRAYASNMDVRAVVTNVAKFIKGEKIKDLHVKSITGFYMDSCECDRCHGNGFIKAFSHVCEGVCFQCYGSGTMVVKRTLSV